MSITRVFTLVAACTICSAVERGTGEATVALAVQGGGLRAQSASAGLMAGMMAYVVQQDKSSPSTLLGTGLLDRFDTLSSNSGGSWFTSSLVYSGRYLALVEGMAASPTTAGAQHHAKWTMPWLAATKVQDPDFNWADKIARRVATKILGKGDEDTLFLLKYFLASNLTWNHWTNVLLNSTADIDESVALGSPVNTWAKNKDWFAAHSVLLPTKKAQASLHKGNILGLPSCYYYADGSLPVALPAKFSIKLGAGTNSSAPSSYMPPAIAASLKDLHYDADVVPIFDEPSAEASNLDARDFSNGVLTAGAGAVPVVGVASSSSAFGGIAPTLGVLVDEALKITDGDFTPWVTNAANGRSFAVGSQLYEGLANKIDKAAVQGLASASFHGLIDGGYTDNTAIAQAIAAGADEVLAVLNTNSTATAISLLLLFKDGPAPSDPGSSRVVLPVFDNPVAATVDTDVSQFHNLKLPNSTFLKVLSAGTINAVTAENKFWGISAGRSVKINVVNIGSILSIGFLQAISNYDSFVQEIVDTLQAPSNAGFMSSTLLPMFKGAAATQVVTIV